MKKWFFSILMMVGLMAFASPAAVFSDYAQSQEQSVGYAYVIDACVFDMTSDFTGAPSYTCDEVFIYAGVNRIEDVYVTADVWSNTFYNDVAPLENSYKYTFTAINYKDLMLRKWSSENRKTCNYSDASGVIVNKRYSMICPVNRLRT